MLQVKIDTQDELIDIKDFEETVEILNDEKLHQARLYFIGLNPFGENSIDYIMEILKNVTSVSLIESGVPLFSINGEFQISRVSREIRKNEFVLTAVLSLIG